MIEQVISVGENTSRVLLLTDVTHSIPVQVLRNDVRVIASGTGHSDELTLDNVPRSVDIEKGDLLVTSGLGGRFVEGYPVAVVQSVSRDGSNYFATVKAKPLAELDRLRYLLLLWPSNLDMSKVKSMSPEEVRRLVQQRLESQAHEAKHSVRKPKLWMINRIALNHIQEKKSWILKFRPQCLNKRNRFLQSNKNIGMKTNARAFYFSMGDHFMLFVVALVMELAP